MQLPSGGLGGLGFGAVTVVDVVVVVVVVVVASVVVASVVVVVASHHEIEAEIAILFYALPLTSPQANVVIIELLAKGPSDQ